MPWWHRLIVFSVVLLATAIVARLIDRRIARRELEPGAATRYRVLRRTVLTGVVVVGVLSSLLVIPEVQAVAGGLLASSAVVGIIVGFASQRTLGNFVAGLLIAVSQPLRLGDDVEVDGRRGTVEEIGLTYTFIRLPDDSRVVIPNEKLASDTIRNSSIRSREKLAEVTLQIPLTSDVEAALQLLREELPGEGGEVFVSGLDDHATLTARAWAPSSTEAEALAADFRRRAHARLRTAGIYG
jgi:small-conductance mechanosensitive channel